ncbi:hypothetical protein GCM10022403_094150 [Streptomyces coacervatus]|uniref:Uncharacterized protein n=1 Tax=Streptomyces coacervatus TaxID=647381 RepID=A0ABP7JL60_9ACTN|nr:hypothetical protein [Streptomyces coacervatus]MDF2264435.1 hypothetical protein [Streptomyces coacervatus]
MSEISCVRGDVTVVMLSRRHGEVEAAHGQGSALKGRGAVSMCGSAAWARPATYDPQTLTCQGPWQLIDRGVKVTVYDHGEAQS